MEDNQNSLDELIDEIGDCFYDGVPYDEDARNRAKAAINKTIMEEVLAIIGEDETISMDGYDIRDNPPYSYRNHLRAEQRQQLIEKYGEGEGVGNEL